MGVRAEHAAAAECLILPVLLVLLPLLLLLLPLALGCIYHVLRYDDDVVTANYPNVWLLAAVAAWFIHHSSLAAAVAVCVFDS